MDQLLRDITSASSSTRPSAQSSNSPISILTPTSAGPQQSRQSQEPSLLSLSSTRILTKSAPPPPPSTTTTSSSSSSSTQTLLAPLRSEPSYETLLSTLSQILTSNASPLDPRCSPPTKSAPLVFTLLERILPHFWAVLQEGGNKDGLELFLTPFRTAGGVAGCVARLRLLLGSGSGSAVTGDANKVLAGQVLELLGDVLEGEGLVGEVRRQTMQLGGVQAGLVWSEFVSLVAGGKVLSVAAEAVRYLGMEEGEKKGRWVGDGRRLSAWLGRGVARAVHRAGGVDVKPFGQVLGRGLGLGYPDELVRAVDENILSPQDDGLDQQKASVYHERYQALLSSLQSHEKRVFLSAWLRIKSATISPKSSFQPSSGPPKPKWWVKDLPDIQKIAIQLKNFNQVPDFTELVLDWIIQESSASTGVSLSMRRAAILSISDDLESIRTIFEKTLQSFGDSLWIKHTPLLRQEGTTQTLLLTASILHRTRPLILEKQAKTSTYLNAISNRLGANSTRAKVLGMLVGESISSLVQKEDSKARLKFNMDDMNTDEMGWWKDIILIYDKMPSPEEKMRMEMDDMQISKKRKTVTTVADSKDKPKLIKGFGAPPKKAETSQASSSKKPFVAPPKKGPAIIELLSDDESDEEDPDLVPYAKPVEDAEDSDDDPTTINRNKPSTPVYIRQLLTYLAKTDSYDHIDLALKNATNLIRTKAGFGTEVTAHSTDLYNSILALQDAFEIPNFATLKLQSLIALVEADPKQIPIFAIKLFWEADLSISQRLNILSSLVLGARLLAGHDDSKVTSLPPTDPTNPTFPTSLLSPHLHDLYTLTTLSRATTRAALQPLAASAASTLSGPSALQVQPQPKSAIGHGTTTRTSRRLALTASGAYTPQSLTTLSTLAVPSFLYPLITTLHLYLPHSLATSTTSHILHPPLLESYLKSLALIITAAGPSTPNIWDPLTDLLSLVSNTLIPRISFRAPPPRPASSSSSSLLFIPQQQQGLEEQALIEPIATLALSMLELLKEAGDGVRKMVVERVGGEMGRVVGWAAAGLEVGEGGEEGEEVRGVLAGVVVRWGEVVEGL